MAFSEKNLGYYIYTLTIFSTNFGVIPIYFIKFNFDISIILINVLLPFLDSGIKGHYPANNSYKNTPKHHISISLFQP